MVTEPDSLVVGFNDYWSVKGIALDNLDWTTFAEAKVVKPDDRWLVNARK